MVFWFHCRRGGRTKAVLPLKKVKKYFGREIRGKLGLFGLFCSITALGSDPLPGPLGVPASLAPFLRVGEGR